MRIGLLTTSFPRFDGDTAGHFVHGFARALGQRGHRVEVLAPEPNEGQAPVFDDLDLTWVPYARPRGLARTFYGAGVPDNLRRDPRAWLGLLPFTASLLAHAARRAKRWDAVVSHWALPCGLIGSGLARWTALPHLCVVHSADMWLLRRVVARRALARRIAGPRTRMWFVAPHLRSQFEQLLAGSPGSADLRDGQILDDCHVGPMGFSPTPIAPRTRSTDGKLRLLTLGRLIPIKGLDVLIRAIVGDPEIALTVAGQGPERDALTRLARNLGANVEFAGQVSGGAKAKLLSEADVFVLPSRTLASGRSEGAPTGVIEAMAAGLPIIATDTGGISSLLHDGLHGRIVEPDNRALLRSAIQQLSGDPRLRKEMGDAAAAHVAHLAWPQLVGRIEDMLTPDENSVAGRRDAVE